MASQRREIERQQILQRLIASQVPSGNPGYNSIPGETVLMTQFGLQAHSSLLTTIQDTSDATGMDSNMAAQLQLQLDLKAEKKVGERFKVEIVVLCSERKEC